MEPASIRNPLCEQETFLSEGDDSEPPGQSLSPLLARLKQAIWHRRPVLEEIMGKHGDKILYDYAGDFLDVNLSPRLDARKEELISSARDLTEERLGRDVAEKVALQLRKSPLVSTADHHAPIDHPFWVNANLISALPYAEHADPDLQNLIVFSFASVSLNNASGYPRGVTFHGGMDGSKNLLRLPLLPDKLKTGVVYGMRPFTADDLSHMDKELARREKNGEVAPGRGDSVRALLREYFAAPDVLSAPDYAMQITKINYRLWPALFHPSAVHGKKASSIPLPDLIYLDIESLVSRLLLLHHIEGSSSLLNQVIFSSEYRESALRHFDGVPGAFSREKDTGTFFFWGIDDKHRRVRLRLTDSALVSPDGTFRVELLPAAIATALRSKQIFPSMLLCYLTVSLYYGMKCLGGFCQVNDLTMAKESWRKVLLERGETDEAEAVIPVQTKELGGDGMVLAYALALSGELIPATGIDLALDRRDTSFAKYLCRSMVVTLSEMMNSMLPEMYTVLYAATERERDLCSLSPEEIVSGTGLKDKLLKDGGATLTSW